MKVIDIGIHVGCSIAWVDGQASPLVTEYGSGMTARGFSRRVLLYEFNGVRIDLDNDEIEPMYFNDESIPKVTKDILRKISYRQTRYWST